MAVFLDGKPNAPDQVAQLIGKPVTQTAPVVPKALPTSYSLAPSSPAPIDRSAREAAQAEVRREATADIIAAYKFPVTGSIRAIEYWAEKLTPDERARSVAVFREQLVSNKNINKGSEPIIVAAYDSLTPAEKVRADLMLKAIRGK